jgi:hypothetical protein
MGHRHTKRQHCLILFTGPQAIMDRKPQGRSSNLKCPRTGEPTSPYRGFYNAITRYKSKPFNMSTRYNPKIWVPAQEQSTDTSRPGKKSKRDSRPGARDLRKYATNNSAMGVDERPAQHLQYCPDVLILLHGGNPALDNGDNGIHSDVICLEGPFCGLRIMALAVRATQNRGLL